MVPERSPIVGAVDDLVTEQCDFWPSELEAASDAPLQNPIAPDAVAHLLFTSGSTGLPKAVAVTHANVRHFVDWAVHYFDIVPGERVSGHAPFHFDLSTFDIYGAFSAGAEVHLVPPALNLLPAKLADFIASRELDQWFSVPTTLTQLANAHAIAPGSLPDLKRMLWCGEAIPLPTLRSLMATLPAVQFTNLYGPTETTIASSFFTVDEPPETDASSVSIGQPLPGEDLVILGEGDEPAAQGEVGELCISGAGLTNGYWQEAERTAEAFVTDPRGGGGRLYRTGDLARVGPDGRIYLLGRRDHQVKIRGYRIELGEIEAALHRLPMVDAAAVVVVDRGGPEGLVLCCGAVLRAGSDDIVEVQKSLGELVPRYMLPGRWRLVDALPLNQSGKVDRGVIRTWFAGEESE